MLAELGCDVLDTLGQGPLGCEKQPVGTAQLVDLFARKTTPLEADEIEPDKMGGTFAPQKNGHLALHVDDVAAARAALEAKGVEFAADTFDTGVCHMAFFNDPDGNDIMLHSRHTPRG